MQTKTKLLLSAAGLAALASLAFVGSSVAQDGWRHGPRHSSQGGHEVQMAHSQMHGHHMAGQHGGGFRGHGKGGHMAMRLLERYDANGDGKVSQEEIDRGRGERLASFDGDQDGKLSLAEFEALWLDAMRERMVDSFQGFDDDGDGLVTGEEYGKPFQRMVERMDRNGDGLLGFDDRGRRHEGRDHKRPERDNDD